MPHGVDALYEIVWSCGEEMMPNDEICPNCAGSLEYDEIDIGVGVQRGNYYCPNCGWEPPALDIEDGDDWDIDDWEDA